MACEKRGKSKKSRLYITRTSSGYCATFALGNSRLDGYLTTSQDSIRQAGYVPQAGLLRALTNLTPSFYENGVHVRFEEKAEPPIEPALKDTVRAVVRRLEQDAGSIKALRASLKVIADTAGKNLE